MYQDPTKATFANGPFLAVPPLSSLEMPLNPPGWYLADGIDRLFRCHEDTDAILFSRYSLGQSQAQSSDSLEAWGRKTFSLSVITLESSDVANSDFWEPCRWSCHWVWPLGRPRQWETQRSALRVYGRRALTWDHAVLHSSPSPALSSFAFKQLYIGASTLCQAPC